MKQLKHTAIYTMGDVDSHWLLKEIQQGNMFEFTAYLQSVTGELFAADALQYFIDEELRHDRYIISTENKNLLSTSSNGEKRMALLRYIIAQKPKYIIAENIFDSLDTNAQQYIKQMLEAVSADTLIVQIMSRKSDCLPFIDEVFTLDDKTILFRQKTKEFLAGFNVHETHFTNREIPPPIHKYEPVKNPLIKLQNVSVHYEERKILDNICWEINAGEFWQLTGPNGSGKTTLLAMITGDNTKGYGQNLTLFGNRKGSGESVWEIKEKIGYFASYMLQNFDRMHTAEQMITGGFFDSVGLYNIASFRQEQLAQEWLKLLGLFEKRNTIFRHLTPAHQCLVLLARAMVKHPPLLILDEPTSSLDDAGAALFSALINKIAAETSTTILYVSHRKEGGLEPQHIYQLEQSVSGSKGVQLK